MEAAAPSLNDFTQLLAAELAQIRSVNRRNFIEARLITPFQATLEWEYGSDEPFDAWTFADMGERNVVAQYCRGGFGALGSPWGINFKAAAHFGMDCGWYQSLDALIEDWGIPE